MRLEKTRALKASIVYCSASKQFPWLSRNIATITMLNINSAGTSRLQINYQQTKRIRFIPYQLKTHTKHPLIVCFELSKGFCTEEAQDTATSIWVIVLWFVGSARSNIRAISVCRSNCRPDFHLQEWLLLSYFWLAIA